MLFVCLDTPNVCGVIRRLSSSVPTFQRSLNLFEYARKCVQTGIDYFHKQLAINLKISLAASRQPGYFSTKIAYHQTRSRYSQFTQLFFIS